MSIRSKKSIGDNNYVAPCRDIDSCPDRNKCRGEYTIIKGKYVKCQSYRPPEKLIGKALEGRA